jgi:hypothetical protein
MGRLTGRGAGRKTTIIGLTGGRRVDVVSGHPLQGGGEPASLGRQVGQHHLTQLSRQRGGPSQSVVGLVDEAPQRGRPSQWLGGQTGALVRRRPATGVGDHRCL